MIMMCSGREKGERKEGDLLPLVSTSRIYHLIPTGDSTINTCFYYLSHLMAATIDADTRRKANLRVLQRIDPNIVDLAITATHVVLYEFSNIKRNWEKKNVEGSLFVTKRSDTPRFKLIVLNRSSTENLEVPITATFQMQVKEPYMIFRDSAASAGAADETIRGIWFHDGKERDQIASYLENVVKSLQKIEEMERKNQPNSASTTDNSSSNVNDTVRQDAGAALLSTLTLGSTNNHGTTTSAAPAAAATSTPATQQQNVSPPSTHQNLVLDKKSLQLSLLSLIQDDRFIDLIHAQYLKVVHTRAQRSQQQQQQQQHQQAHQQAHQQQQQHK